MQDELYRTQGHRAPRGFSGMSQQPRCLSPANAVVCSASDSRWPGDGRELAPLIGSPVTHLTRASSLKAILASSAQSSLPLHQRRVSTSAFPDRLRMREPWATLREYSHCYVLPVLAALFLEWLPFCSVLSYMFMYKNKMAEGGVGQNGWREKRGTGLQLRNK